MSESSKTASNDAKSDNLRPGKICKIGYIVSVYDGLGELIEAPFATFDRGLAEEIALEYAWEYLWRAWFYEVHVWEHCHDGFVSRVYNHKLSDTNVFVKEIKWHE